MTRNAEKTRQVKKDPVTEFGRWYAVSGLSVADIIKVLDCSKSYAYDLIRGHKVPSLQNAVALIDMSKAMRKKNLQPEDFLSPDPEQD